MARTTSFRASTPARGSADRVTIRPADLRPLFGGDFGEALLLAVSPRIRPSLELIDDGTTDVREVLLAGRSSRDRLRAHVRSRRVAVLWIGDEEFVHFSRDEVRSSKVAALSFFSAAFTTSRLRDLLDLVYRTDYEGQVLTERRISRLLASGQCILLQSQGASATLDVSRTQHWFSLNGPLDFGDQTVLPTGEMSVLTNASGEYSGVGFPLEGQVLLQGIPVVHRSDAAVRVEAAEALFRELSAMAREAVLLEIEGGHIERIRPTGDSNNQLARSLEKLFTADARYRKIHEIGFGTNPLCSPLVTENSLANERFPGVHLGIGLGGHTAFHVDLVCPDIQVLVKGRDGRLTHLYAPRDVTDPVARATA